MAVMSPIKRPSRGNVLVLTFHFCSVPRASRKLSVFLLRCLRLSQPRAFSGICIETFLSVSVGLRLATTRKAWPLCSSRRK